MWGKRRCNTRLLLMSFCRESMESTTISSKTLPFHSLIYETPSLRSEELFYPSTGGSRFVPSLSLTTLVSLESEKPPPLWEYKFYRSRISTKHYRKLRFGKKSSSITLVRLAHQCYRVLRMLSPSPPSLARVFSDTAWQHTSGLGGEAWIIQDSSGTTIQQDS